MIMVHHPLMIPFYPIRPPPSTGIFPSFRKPLFGSLWYSYRPDPTDFLRFAAGKSVKAERTKPHQLQDRPAHPPAIKSMIAGDSG